MKGRIAFVDAPRELVSVALCTLGASMNASSRQLQHMGITQQRLSQQLDKLRNQVLGLIRLICMPVSELSAGAAMAIM